jgi:hypothetical protein
MPFISSVRGSYGSQGRRKTQTGRISEATGGTITVSGGYRIHTFTAPGLSTFTPDGAGTIEVFMWGAGGGSGNSGGWSYGANAGGGGYSSGTINLGAVGSYAVMVGEKGLTSSTSSSDGGTTGLFYSQGGGAPANRGNADNRYAGQGGGLSGIFETSYTAPNALIIAGGGGGGGASRAGTGNTGGAGGGSTGSDGAAPYDGRSPQRGRGGRQDGTDESTTGQFITTNDDGSGAGAYTAPTQLKGARTRSYGGGGGGGWWGGSGGEYYESNTMAGGGGGSGYIHPTKVTSGVLTAGSGATPGNSGDSRRAGAGEGGQPVGGTSGRNGTNGIVIIRYPI